MVIVNSVSGGKTSSYLHIEEPADYSIFSLVCIDDPTLKPKDPAIVKYVNEKLSDFSVEFGDFIATTEDDQTLIALMDLEQLSGRKITWVRGKSFDTILNTPNTHGGTPTRLPGKQFRYCTDEMKLVPIFKWWFRTIGEKVKMNIGFRFDEFSRIETFFNRQPNHFKIPVSCNTYGSHRQRHEVINWRSSLFPLAKKGIIKDAVNHYWRGKRVRFPEISNCVGCFWKEAETLSVMANTQRPKMEWFAGKEQLGKGTWKPGITYQKIIDNAEGWLPEMVKENASCDSGGCHD